ncbi:unnamed protein product [Blepharisma stoltei]|uniref:Prohibitin n=1 Tax=Blepharisma stoltei TaxID=1481888 RepID=A0AAU9IWL1_9CILI|nr:unnamed protein product [Blepharisma stoltei]
MLFVSFYLDIRKTNLKCSDILIIKIMGKIKLALYVGVGIATYQILKNSICYVRKDENVVIFDKFEGVRNIVYGEGFHFIYPWIQIPVYFKVSPSELSFAHKFSTKDSQGANIKLDITYRPVKNDLPKIYLSFGLDYGKRIIPSLGHEVVKEVIKNYSSAELDQDQILNKIKENLIPRASEFFITIDDIKITIENSA